MKLSEKGAAVLTLREGLRTRAYRDTKGIWTIGVGHTGPEVVEGLVITKEEAMDLFRKDVMWAEECVNSNVTMCLTPNQFDALVSFVFNVGCGAFKRSTMLKRINEGNFLAAVKEFDRWHIPIEITSRRDSEREQFRS